MSGLAFENVVSLRAKLAKKEVSPVEVTEALLERISQVDPKVKAYNYLNPESALEQARKADVSLPLGGVPIAVKDVINVTGEPCTCSSTILRGYVAPYDAATIEKLRAAGAVLLGRTNMDEFAMGSSTETSAWGPTHNPWDLERIPGGSSGGSAAAVGGHEAFAALGSDTGGSIRQPAALTGCVGLKPTYGRVSRYGLTAFASSLDQIGPFTKTVADSALLLEVLSGHDKRDNTSAPRPVPNYSAALTGDVKGLRLGVPKEYFIKGIDPEVEKAVRDAIAQFEKLGGEVVEVSLPHTEYAVAVYYIVATAEASANLARFDGVRYGRRPPGAADVIGLYGQTREAFGQEVKRRIILGTHVLSSGYYDAYYNRAQKVRQLLRQDFEAAFKQCDVILTPTSPTAAWKLGEVSDPLQMYLADIFTIAVNLAGICGLSLPCGFTSKKLPIGLQVLGPMWGEETVLRAAHAYEQATAWHKELPPL
ncbi:MAG: Asp-tRNA(Asn)/Glu-tRNA(Gln) amidotransferase subunit GatA [Verrucomicrobium sp.]|nr:Asp-tRNA(Asn)/Glu-tRNA(Gln) amidotransferase subunit GatA [Verrucomicrobium sp.]